MVMTLASSISASQIPGQGASRLKAKTKDRSKDCSRFSKDFKNGPHQNIFKKIV